MCPLGCVGSSPSQGILVYSSGFRLEHEAVSFEPAHESRLLVNYETTKITRSDCGFILSSGSFSLRAQDQRICRNQNHSPSTGQP